MKYWLIIDNVQLGPLTIEEVAAQQGLRASTPVWHEGLSDWTTAGQVPEIAALLTVSSVEQSLHTQENNHYSHYGQTSPQPTVEGYYADPARMTEPRPMPPTHLIWAIAATLCCCLPLGVVAIFYSSKVSPAYYRGDYEAALKASEQAELWVIIAFVAGLIAAPFTMLLNMI